MGSSLIFCQKDFRPKIEGSSQALPEKIIWFKLVVLSPAMCPIKICSNRRPLNGPKN